MTTYCRAKIHILLLFVAMFAVIAQPALCFSETETPAPTSISTPPENNKDLSPVFPFEDLIPKPVPQDDRFFTELLNMLATLGLILALILFAAWFLKRMMTSRLNQINTSNSIKIVERRVLSQKTMLYVIEYENINVLIAESQNGVAKLAELPIEKERSLPAEVEFPSPFTKILDKNS